MSKFRFDLKARKFRSELNAMANRIGNLAVDHVKNEIFPSESFDGKKWAPPKKKQDHPLLQKTGRLRASIHVIRANSKGVKFGTSLAYGGYQNKGTRTIPARKFLGMDRKLASIIKKEVSLTLRAIMKK